MRMRSDSMHDSAEAATRALTCFRVLDRRFRRPRPRLDVASLLEREHEAAVADDRALRQPLQDAFLLYSNTQALVTGGDRCALT